MLIYCLIFVYLFDLIIASVYNILHVTLLKLGVRVCKINFYNIYKYVKNYQYFLLPWVDRVHFHSINIQHTRERRKNNNDDGDDKKLLKYWSDIWLPLIIIFFLCVSECETRKNRYLYLSTISVEHQISYNDFLFKNKNLCYCARRVRSVIKNRQDCRSIYNSYTRPSLISYQGDDKC